MSSFGYSGTNAHAVVCAPASPSAAPASSFAASAVAGLSTGAVPTRRVRDRHLVVLATCWPAPAGPLATAAGVFACALSRRCLPARGLCDELARGAFVSAALSVPLQVSVPLQGVGLRWLLEYCVSCLLYTSPSPRD